MPGRGGGPPARAAGPGAGGGPGGLATARSRGAGLGEEAAEACRVLLPEVPSSQGPAQRGGGGGGPSPTCHVSSRFREALWSLHTTRTLCPVMVASCPVSASRLVLR